MSKKTEKIIEVKDDDWEIESAMETLKRYAKLVEDKKLKEEKNKLEEQNTKWKEDYIALENLKDNQIADLEKKLEQAKTILQKLLELIHKRGYWSVDVQNAEQFIKENE